MPALPPNIREEDYEAIEAAVMESARGRWFLAEYARRNRNADTQAVLDAIEVLAGKLAAPAAPEPAGANEQAKQQILAAAEDVQEAAWALRELGANPDFCARLDRNAAEISAACSLQDAPLTDDELPEIDIVEEEAQAFSAHSALIEAQSVQMPQSSLPQIQAKLTEEWPEEEFSKTAANNSQNAPFNYADYSFEEKLALFS